MTDNSNDNGSEHVRLIDIESEVRTSFLEYAMSVIVSRALPDVRDGLKPVHRRILYSMYDAGIRPGTPFRKSARVVGDVMGWFHPHSNDAIYDALVRMGQDFAIRYGLIEPQGNFGTVDDPPAAMPVRAASNSVTTKSVDGDQRGSFIRQFLIACGAIFVSSSRGRWPRAGWSTPPSSWIGIRRARPGS